MRLFKITEYVRAAQFTQARLENVAGRLGHTGDPTVGPGNLNLAKVYFNSNREIMLEEH